MKEVKVTNTRYKCENCGATYSDKGCIQQCPVTGKEICKKCGATVEDIFCVDFDGEPYNFYFECRNINVHPSTIKNQFDWYREEYVQEVSKLQEEFVNKLKALNTAYLLDKMNEYKQGGQNGKQN